MGKSPRPCHEEKRAFYHVRLEKLYRHLKTTKQQKQKQQTHTKHKINVK